MEKTDIGPRSRIFCAGCVVIFCSAGTSAFSVFVDPLVTATRATPGQVTLALTLYQFFMAVFGIVSGRVVDRAGPRRMLLLGGLFTFLAWAVTAYASSLAMLYLGFGLLAGMGIGFIYNAAINTTLRWFPDKRGTMSGALLASASLGTLVMAKAGALLCHHYGQHGVIYAGLTYLILIWASARFMFLPDPQWSPPGWTPPPSSGPAQRGYTPLAMLRTGRFWFVLLLFSLACTSGVMMVGMLSPIAQTQLRLTPVEAATLVSISSLANFGGRLLLGRLCDRCGESVTLALIFILTAASLLGLGQAMSWGAFMLCLIALGGAFGGVMVVFPPLTTRLFGIVHSGANYGIMFFGYAVGALVGPQIAAQAMNPALGPMAFLPAYRIALAVALAGLGLSLLFMAQDRRRSRAPASPA